jgi:hypothetical protein
MVDADFGQSRMISYIDSHTHMHSLPWDTWELLGTCGMQGAVILAGSPYCFRSVRSEVPGPSEIEEFWVVFENANAFYDLGLAVPPIADEL